MAMWLSLSLGDAAGAARRFDMGWSHRARPLRAATCCRLCPTTDIRPGLPRVVRGGPVGPHVSTAYTEQLFDAPGHAVVSVCHFCGCGCLVSPPNPKKVAAGPECRGEIGRASWRVV